MSRESIVEDISTRQPSVLICSEKAVYIYSLAQVVQVHQSSGLVISLYHLSWIFICFLQVSLRE